jgi:hypothetical protein
MWILLLCVEADEEQQKVRFQVELEFVQCLANPNYLNCEYSRDFQSFILFCVSKCYS